MNLNIGKSFNIAVHALTLSLILNMIYIVINTLTGFTIKYFQVMYTAIAYIYIITAIFMIKSDYNKRNIELQKIKSEQEKIRDELNLKEEEKKNQKEKDDVKNRDKEKEGKNSSSDKPKIGDKPEGSNV